MRRSWWRLVLGVSLTLLAVLEAQSLARTLRNETKAVDQARRRVREEADSRRRSLETALAAGGADSLHAAGADLPVWFASELELFDQQGVRWQAYPHPSPAEHWLNAADLALVRAGRPRTVGPVGATPRILTYLSVSSGGSPWILRVASPASELAAEQAERRETAVGDGMALVIILLIAVLMLLPARVDSVDTGGGVLRAYEEAMGRLQARGAALSLQHQQETQQLRSALDDKDAMARAGELTAGIVHEVRNGLGTIGGYAQMLEREAASADTAAAAHHIREECATLETVVRRFMDFVKRESLTLAPLDVGRMLARVAAREGRPEGGGVIVLPDPVPAATMVGDEEMLERAFENLVRNAREAGGPGGHVWIELAIRDESVIVGIADDGPGLPPERRQTIRPFTSTKGSLGLGLPTALKIVTLHGGELMLNERRPRGLNIVVRLPSEGPSVRPRSG
jgi:signal transduction histidine kinase